MKPPQGPSQLIENESNNPVCIEWLRYLLEEYSSIYQLSDHSLTPDQLIDSLLTIWSHEKGRVIIQYVDRERALTIPLMADELKVKPGNIYYIVRQLQECGYLREVGELDLPGRYGRHIILWAKYDADPRDSQNAEAKTRALIKAQIARHMKTRLRLAPEIEKVAERIIENSRERGHRDIRALEIAEFCKAEGITNATQRDLVISLVNKTIPVLQRT